MKNFIRKRLRKKDSEEQKKVERREVSLPSSHLGKQSFMVQRVLWHKYIRISTLLIRRSLSIIVSIEEGAIWKKKHRLRFVTFYSSSTYRCISTYELLKCQTDWLRFLLISWFHYIGTHDKYSILHSPFSTPSVYIRFSIHSFPLPVSPYLVSTSYSTKQSTPLASLHSEAYRANICSLSPEPSS